MPIYTSNKQLNFNINILLTINISHLEPQAMSNKPRVTRPVKPKTTPQSTTQAVTTPVAQDNPVVSAEQPKVEVKAEQPVVQPVETKTEPTVAQTTAQTNTAAEQSSEVKAENAKPGKKTRTQMNSEVCKLSLPRVRRHADKFNVNKTVDRSISENKEHIHAHKVASQVLEKKEVTVVASQVVDGKKKMVQTTRPATYEDLAAAQKTVDEVAPKLSDYEMKVNALAKERLRFADKSSVALGAVADKIVKDLVGQAMSTALKNKRKIIQVEHIHSDGVEKLPTYPLFSTLPTFKNMADKLAKEEDEASLNKRIEVASAKAVKEAEKRFKAMLPKAPKKKDAAEGADKPAEQPKTETKAAEPKEQSSNSKDNHLNLKTEKPAEQPKTETKATEPKTEKPTDKAAEDDDDDDSDEKKTSFKCYISDICKDLAKGEYDVIRVSTEIKAYLSDLVVEFIHRISQLVLLTAASMKNKTINENAILRTIEALMIDGHEPVETIEFSDDEVPDPVVVRAEAKKRDEEKLQGREYKVDVSKIPRVKGYKAVHTVSYPTSGYSALAELVKEKLKLYESLSEEAKKSLVDNDSHEDADVLANAL